jgi:hypothetical protein
VFQRRCGLNLAAADFQCCDLRIACQFDQEVIEVQGAEDGGKEAKLQERVPFNAVFHDGLYGRKIPHSGKCGQCKVVKQSALEPAVAAYD